MWCGRRTIIWGSELSNKSCGLKQPPIHISKAITNQKHVCMMEERKATSFNWGRAWEKCDSIVLGAIELGGDKTKMKSMSSLINFFLG
jgi:hypothetical protein